MSEEVKKPDNFIPVGSYQHGGKCGYCQSQDTYNAKIPREYLVEKMRVTIHAEHFVCNHCRMMLPKDTDEGLMLLARARFEEVMGRPPKRKLFIEPSKQELEKLKDLQ